MRPLAGGILLFALALTTAPRPASATVADDLCGPLADPCVVSSTVTVTPDSVLDFGSRTLQLAAGATVNWSSNLTIVADAVQIDLGSQLVEKAAVATRGFLDVQCRTSSIAGKIKNKGAGVWIHDDAPGEGPHTLQATGQILVADDQEALIAIDSFGDVTVAGKITSTAKIPTEVPGEFRLTSVFGNVQIPLTGKVKLKRALADTFSEIVIVRADSGTLTIDGLLEAGANEGAYAVLLEANQDVAIGPKAKVKAKSKLIGHASVGINSQLGSVLLAGKVYASTKDSISDSDGVGICASQDIVLDPKALIDGKSASGGTIVLGAGGEVRLGGALGGAKILGSLDSADIELCGGAGVTISSTSRILPEPAVVGGSGDCLSPASPVSPFFLDCNQ